MNKTTKARKYNSSKLQELLDEVTPLEMEQTKWFSGTQNFTTDVLTEIASALGVELTELFGKKQVQVIYRKEIVVKSTAPQPTFIITTPMSQGIDAYGNCLLTSQGNKSPFTKYYQA